MTTIAPLRACSALLLLLLLASCAGQPKGDDVAGDIRGYAYQNWPRLSGDWIGAGDPFHKDAQALAFTTGADGATIASSDFPWRIPLECRRQYRAWIANQATRVADQTAFLGSGLCAAKAKEAFVAAAITGGGNKSAVYATEVLFELQRYGITDDLDLVSSVSGGSFPALLYALSCDPTDTACKPAHNGWTRPVWDYGDMTRQMETNYFWPFVGKRFLPSHLFANAVKHHGSDDDLGDTVADRLLRQDKGDLTFADLEPRRPNLILNASNVTRDRASFDQDSNIPYEAKRPLSDDDALHFSFTQQYFWRLLSDLNRFPIKYALVASAAFPLIIDPPSLRHFRKAEIDALKKPSSTYSPGITPEYVSLWDGGVHDNFGVTEILWFVQCQFGQNVRRVTWNRDIYQRECGTQAKSPAPPKAILTIGINSSLLRSTGLDETWPKHRSWDSYVLPVRISGTAQSVDMIMAASGEQRKMQLRSVLESLDHGHHDPNNPFTPHGNYQYIDVDIEALLYATCPNGPLDPRPVNSANGGSDKSRCDQLKGVLDWSARRNLQLPTISPTLCPPDKDKCPALTGMGGSDTNFVITDAKGQRLLSNQWLFAAVRNVPTDFQLNQTYAWLLRYAARWSVAVRLWDLCHHNPRLLDRLTAGSRRVCDSPLPDRVWKTSDKTPYDDNVGSDAWHKVFGYR